MKYKVNIDFIEASSEWRLNKKNVGNGFFVYRCTYIHSNGRMCGRPQGLLCKRHIRRVVDVEGQNIHSPINEGLHS